MRVSDFGSMLAALESVRESENPILVVTHEWPDGDAIGSSCGMWRMLCDNGYRAALFLPDEIPDAYRSFLPKEALVRPEPATVNASFSMILNVDASTVKRMGLGPIRFADLTIPVVTFDHHPDNELFGDLSYVDPEGCSTAETLCLFAESCGWTIGPDAATWLLLGVTTDTGCFRFSNADASAHRTAGTLLARGADNDRIMNEVYFSKPLNLARFEAALLGTLETEFDGRFAWCRITREMLDEFGVNLRNTEQTIEQVRGIQGVEIAALVKPAVSQGIYQVSLRSKNPEFSVGRIARGLNGGGHEMAAGGTIFAKTPEQAIEILLQHVRKELYHEA